MIITPILTSTIPIKAVLAIVAPVCGNVALSLYANAMLGAITCKTSANTSNDIVDFLNIFLYFLSLLPIPHIVSIT